jgi:hypothetical protein
LSLPSYSPDCTPIEQAFSKVKAFLRGVGDWVREALIEAIVPTVATITREYTVAWFAHAGYALPSQKS